MSRLVSSSAPRLALCVFAVLIFVTVRAEEPAGRRAGSAAELCVTLGKGTEKLAGIRDRGLPRDAAISELLGNKPAPERLKPQLDFMAGFAYEFPKLGPSAVGMVAFGACALSSAGLLDRDASAMLSSAAETCQAAHPKDDEEIRSCIDTRIASYVASKAPAPKASPAKATPATPDARVGDSSSR